MEKEFGKLTAEQFKGLIETLPEIRRQGADLQKAIAEVPKQRLDELLVANYNWAYAYELTFREHMALVTYALGLTGYVKALAASPDPHQKLLDQLWDEARADESAITVEVQYAIGLVFSVPRTILSIMLYQRSMSGLI